VRTIALLVAIISLNTIVGRTGVRLDVTAERLHSLSSETSALLEEIDEERPVLVQAFVSREVPEPYVQTRANLLSVLDEISAVSGGRVQVLVEDTDPFTSEARSARERFGIVPREVPDFGSARASFADVFLGMAFTCGAEEEVIPFLDRGLSPEYEIARSIRVVAKTTRKKVGVLETAVNLFGGMDFQTMRSTPPWPVVSELKKQYEVVQVSPSAEVPEDLDALVVALPSSLSQPEMDDLLGRVQAGLPTLFLVDPLPIVNPSLAPSEQPGSDMNPFMRNQAPPPKPKGDIQRFLAQLGVSWDASRIIWDSYNPHPDLAHLPPEVVFVGEGNGNTEAFNRKASSTSELQEVVFLYPVYEGIGGPFVPPVVSRAQGIISVRLVRLSVGADVAVPSGHTGCLAPSMIADVLSGYKAPFKEGGHDLAGWFGCGTTDDRDTAILEHRNRPPAESTGDDGIDPKLLEPRWYHPWSVGRRRYRLLACYLATLYLEDHELGAVPEMGAHTSLVHR